MIVSLVILLAAIILSMCIDKYPPVALPTFGGSLFRIGQPVEEKKAEPSKVEDTKHVDDNKNKKKKKRKKLVKVQPSLNELQQAEQAEPDVQHEEAVRAPQPMPQNMLGFRSPFEALTGPALAAGGGIAVNG